MNISIVCSSEQHPIYPRLRSWANEWEARHRIELVSKVASLSSGDLLFLISCSELVPRDVRSRFRHSLVVHASRLPQGRGWSPHVWQVLEGESVIPVTLLEAEDKVDSGRIWAQREMRLEGHELYDEINALLFDATLELMSYAVDNAGAVLPKEQPADPPSYYPKRTPEDSRIDPGKTLAEQFDLLRVADPNRFPCFFDLRGHRYRIILQKDS